MWASLVAQRLKHLPPVWETQVQSLGREDPLEKEMVTHSSILAWRIPWTEEPGGLQSMGSQRVGSERLHFTSLPLWRTVWRFLKNWKQNCHMTQQSQQSAGHTHWGNQNQKRQVYPDVHCNTVCNSQDTEAPICASADEWIRKLWYIYTMEYYSSIKKNAFESILMRWMKLEPIIQSLVSQKEKHQYSILTHTYGI